jgi:hypothetical protein
MNLVNKYRGSVLPLLVAAATGCSDMNSAEDSYRTVYGPLQAAGAGSNGGGDSGSGGSGGTAPAMEPDLPPEWACLEEPTDRTPVPMGTRITYRVPIVDFDSMPGAAPLLVPNLRVSFCTDAACTLFAAADVVVETQPDPMRPFVYDFTMPYGYNATMKLEAEGYATMYYILGGPMVGTPSGSPVVGGQAIPLLKNAARNELYAGLGLQVPAAADRGDLAVRTLNCVRDAMTGQTTAGTRASGVTLGSAPEDAAAIPYSLSYGNRAAPDRPTDARGVAGFASLRPQNYTVWGIAPVGEEGVPFGETVVPVRNGAVTLLEVREGLADTGWGQ